MERGRYRLKGHDYRLNRWYFITVVTVRRAPLLGRIVGTELVPSVIGRIVQEELDLLTTRRPGVVLPITAVLPNHVHLLIGLPPMVAPEMEESRRFEAPTSGSLGALIGAWKAGVRRRAHAEGHWPDEEVWQRRFRDTVVDGTEEWNGIADYILWNAVNWHLDPLSGSAEPTEEEIRDWKRRNDL